jgi:hypothetical protein
MMTAALVFAALCAATPAFAQKGFTLGGKEGAELDVLMDGKPVARYMYGFDGSTAERLHETYKPYLHIIDPATGKPITKGAGGQFSHHRGVFGGWKITTAGKTYDFWHIVRDEANAKKVVGKPHFLMLNQGFAEKKAGADEAVVAANINWADPEGKPVVQEERRMIFQRAPAPAIVMLDFVTTLKAVAGDTTFAGDPEHAGVQYRPANEVDVKATKYVFPTEKPDLKKEMDLPWAAETYVLDGKAYSVLAMNHPDNPKGMLTSAYRDYGRFGFFPKFDVKQGESKTLRYRFLIMTGDLPAREALQKAYDAYVAK